MSLHDNYYFKYLKYKSKYNKLINQLGGSIDIIIKTLSGGITIRLDNLDISIFELKHLIFLHSNNKIIEYQQQLIFKGKNLNDDVILSSIFSDLVPPLAPTPPLDLASAPPLDLAPSPPLDLAPSPPLDLAPALPLVPVINPGLHLIISTIPYAPLKTFKKIFGPDANDIYSLVPYSPEPWHNYYFHLYHSCELLWYEYLFLEKQVERLIKKNGLTIKNLSDAIKLINNKLETQGIKKINLTELIGSLGHEIIISERKKNNMIKKLKLFYEQIMTLRRNRNYSMKLYITRDRRFILRLSDNTEPVSDMKLIFESNSSKLTPDTQLESLLMKLQSKPIQGAKREELDAERKVVMKTENVLHMKEKLQELESRSIDNTEESRNIEESRYLGIPPKMDIKILDSMIKDETISMRKLLESRGVPFEKLISHNQHHYLNLIDNIKSYLPEDVKTELIDSNLVLLMKIKKLIS
jgi:hypothetical protein